MLILSFFSALLLFSLRWLMNTWSELTVDEVLYHLFAPLQGFVYSSNRLLV